MITHPMSHKIDACITSRENHTSGVQKTVLVTGNRHATGFSLLVKVTGGVSVPTPLVNQIVTVYHGYDKPLTYF
jgi:hypothetical protein